MDKTKFTKEQLFQLYSQLTLEEVKLVKEYVTKLKKERNNT